MTTSRITDYLGAGVAASRPATPAVPSGGMAVYIATDTHEVTAYDGSGWQHIGNEYVNAQTGTTYTVVAADRKKLVTHSNASAIAVTLPQAGTTGFESGFSYDTANLGAGTVTITPTTSTVDGASTVTLAQHDGIRIVSDGTNYVTVRGKGGSSAGTVTSVATGTGLAGGTITGSGTISLAAIANHTVLANTSGSSAAPVSTTVAALLDDALGSTQGDILYRSGSAWTVLAPGTSGNVLQTGGAGANPSWAAPTTGTVTSIVAGTGLSGGTITSTGTVALAAIANHDLLANTSGGSAAPIATTLTALIDDALGSTQGDILYRSGSAWTVLAPGTSGNVLQTGGAGANPSWAAPSGGLSSIADGDVLANISGSSAVPIANTVTAVIDHALGSTQGDILYRGASTWTVLAPGTAGQVLESGGASANPAWASTVTVNAYTTAGTPTWNKPAGCSVVRVVLFGGGGQGGGGVGAAAGSGRSGGTAGGGGAKAEKIMRASDVTSSVTVTVGAGGTTGGAGGNPGAGATGQAGGTSSFGAFVSAFGGGAGIGGPTTAANLGGGGGGGTGGAGPNGQSGVGTTGGLPALTVSTGGIAGQGAGGATGAGLNAEYGGGCGGGLTSTLVSGAAGGGSLFGSAGGGAAGSVTAATPGVASAGGNGGNVEVYVSGATSAGGTAGTVGAGQNGGNGADGDSTKGGQGGGGGAANNAAAGGNGGTGGKCGGGGGGGGGGTSTGGNGGAGGDGAVYVFAW